MKKEPVKIIAEIGINHNGSLDMAKQLIDVSKVAGCDYVKFQKRTPDICVPEAQKNKLKKTPWGEMTYLEYKRKIEFGLREYSEIDKYCKSVGMKWFASVWDNPSVDFMSEFTDIGKIPSALITNEELMLYSRKKFRKLLISTGMSTENEVVEAIKVGKPNVVFHTNSSYPSKEEELNLEYINYLKIKYPNVDIGYSGHEYGLATTFATIPMGASWIERHVSLDRRMWGSDQSASVEPHGLIKLVRGIRNIESALGYYGPRRLLDSELEKRKTLRGE